MTSPAHESDQILRAARGSLDFQRDGGRRAARSIGRGSARLKVQHWGKKLRNVALAAGAIWIGLAGIGLILGGIGFSGLFVGFVATLVAIGVFGSWPRMKEVTRADLGATNTNVKELVGRTELWLEGQRQALPPPAVQLVDQIGLQLDGLEKQLAHVDQNHPQAAEVRKLVGEHLPDIVDGYRQIPEHLRYEDRSGTTPTKQLVSSLETISFEIDSVTRQLATGAIDKLAIKTRYLDYKYGNGIEADGAQD